MHYYKIPTVRNHTFQDCHSTNIHDTFGIFATRSQCANPPGHFLGIGKSSLGFRICVNDLKDRGNHKTVLEP